MDLFLLGWGSEFWHQLSCCAVPKFLSVEESGDLVKQINRLFPSAATIHTKKYPPGANNEDQTAEFVVMCPEILEAVSHRKAVLRVRLDKEQRW